MPEAAKAARKGKLGGWIAFVATLLILSFAAMPGHEAFSTAADRLLIAIRLTLVLALSVLILQERFSSNAHGGGDILRRCRRWFYDE
jgi:hypothetical protein